jgi:hypothetical protein
VNKKQKEKWIAFINRKSQAEGVEKTEIDEEKAYLLEGLKMANCL